MTDVADAGKIYLPELIFGDGGRDDGRYTIEITEARGVVVNSECCADAMTRDVARRVHTALGAYLANGPAPAPAMLRPIPADVAVEFVAWLTAKGVRTGAPSTLKRAALDGDRLVVEHDVSWASDRVILRQSAYTVPGPPPATVAALFEAPNEDAS